MWLLTLTLKMLVLNSTFSLFLYSEPVYHKYKWAISFLTFWSGFWLVLNLLKLISPLEKESLQHINTLSLGPVLLNQIIVYWNY